LVFKLTILRSESSIKKFETIIEFVSKQEGISPINKQK